MINTYYRPQLTPFSCGAACVQMLLAQRQIFVSHLKAIRGTEGFPNGSTKRQIKKAISSFSGYSLELVKVRNLIDYLEKGGMVMATDSVRDLHDHVVVISKFKTEGEKTMVFVQDPLPWRICWKNLSIFSNNKEEFFALR
jgi:hypothetical protein